MLNDSQDSEVESHRGQKMKQLTAEADTTNLPIWLNENGYFEKNRYAMYYTFFITALAYFIQVWLLILVIYFNTFHNGLVTGLFKILVTNETLNDDEEETTTIAGRSYMVALTSYLMVWPVFIDLINTFDEKLIIIQCSGRSKTTKFFIVTQLILPMLILLATISFMTTAENFIDTIANFPIIMYINDIDNYFGSQLVKFLNINVFDEGEPDDFLVFEYHPEERVASFIYADIGYVMVAFACLFCRSFFINLTELFKIVQKSDVTNDEKEMAQWNTQLPFILLGIIVALLSVYIVLAPWVLQLINHFVVKYDRVPHPHHPEKKVKKIKDTLTNSFKEGLAKQKTLLFKNTQETKKDQLQDHFLLDKDDDNLQAQYGQRQMSLQNGQINVKTEYSLKPKSADTYNSDSLKK